MVGRSALPQVLMLKKKSIYDPQMLQPGRNLVPGASFPCWGVVLFWEGWSILPSLGAAGEAMQWARSCFPHEKKSKGLAGRSHAINKCDSCSALAQPKSLGCSKSCRSCSANISSKVSKPKAFPCRQVQPWVKNSPDDFREPQPGLRWL